MRAHHGVGFAPRSLALRIVVSFLLGTLCGSLLPETGNILADTLGLQRGEVFNPFGLSVHHVFNPCFLALGLIGIGVALYFGYRRSR